MTTADALREQQLQDLAARRRQDRMAARRVLAGLAVRHGLTVDQARQLLEMAGLVGDPDDTDTPVVLVDVFNQPDGRASLSRRMTR